MACAVCLVLLLFQILNSMCLTIEVNIYIYLPADYSCTQNDRGVTWVWRGSKSLKYRLFAQQHVQVTIKTLKPLTLTHWKAIPVYSLKRGGTFSYHDVIMKYRDYPLLNRIYGDVIKWKHFCVTGPLWWKSTGHRWITHTKASDAELCCFLWSVEQKLSKQSRRRRFGAPLLLLWSHCNVA